MALATSLQAAALSLCKQGEPLSRLQRQERLAVRAGCGEFSVGLGARPRRVSVRASARAELATASEEAVEGVEEGEGGLAKVQIETLRDCRLGIARYPDFVYNAEGGGGTGSGRRQQREEEEEEGRVAVEFDASALVIPPVHSATTRFLGLPLPPFVCIRVLPDTLKGVIDRRQGKVELEFSARFMFSVGSWYRAPPLYVQTLLTTELAQGRLRQGRGQRLDSQSGECRLVGVAPLAPIDDLFLNTFLTLPTDCLASMAAKFTFFD